MHRQIVIFIASLCACAGAIASDAPVVLTQTGLVRGLTLASGVQV